MVTPEQVQHYITAGLKCDHIEVNGDGAISTRSSSAPNSAAKTWCSSINAYQILATACARKSMRCR